MATRRTPEEISAIVDHCIELEETGGDILGYLWSENYLTPRATWCNFQREWMHRKPYEYTDGKPKTRKEIEMAKRRALTDEERAEAVRIAIDGGNPRKYLEGIGVAEPDSTWAYIKLMYKQKHPDVYTQIPKRIGKVAQEQKIKADVARKTADNAPTVKVDGALKIETPESNRVTVAEVPEKAGKRYTYNALEIAGFGEFYHDKKFNRIDWRTQDGDEISLEPARWKILSSEIVVMLQKLGVDA